jgi:hypothetical protein
VRAIVGLALYGLFLYVLGVTIATAPAWALTSSTGWVRVIPPATANAYLQSSRTIMVSSVGQAIAASSGQSVALRIVTSAGGWPALGVLAGLTLFQLYYNAQQTAAIKAAATPPGAVTINGTTLPAGTTLYTCPGGSQCQWFYAEYITVPTPHQPPQIGCDVTMAGPVPSGWAGWYSGNAPETCLAYRPQSNPNNVATQQPGDPPTGPQVAAYIDSLPANDPNSVATNTTSVGAGSQPTPAQSTTNQPVDASALQTQVVPAGTVDPAATVVDPNAVPPPNTQTQTTQQTQTTTSTTSTTDPQTGAVTTNTTDDSTVSCISGSHDERSFASVLQEHMDRWKGSGIAGQLALLQNLTWPTAYPTYSFSSALFGTFSFDFSQWSGVLTALRTLIIAASSLVAYRIIFVGNK